LVVVQWDEFARVSYLVKTDVLFKVVQREVEKAICLAELHELFLVILGYFGEKV
jgi:hypothetical protein